MAKIISCLVAVVLLGLAAALFLSSPPGASESSAALWQQAFTSRALEWREMPEKDSRLTWEMEQAALEVAIKAVTELASYTTEKGSAALTTGDDGYFTTAGLKSFLRQQPAQETLTKFSAITATAKGGELLASAIKDGKIFWVVRVPLTTVYKEELQESKSETTIVVVMTQPWPLSGKPHIEQWIFESIE